MKYYIEYCGCYYPIRWAYGWTRIKHRAREFNSMEEANQKLDELKLFDSDLARVVKE